MQETTRNHPPAGASGRGSKFSTWGADRMEHCSGGLISLFWVRTNRFSGTGSSPARVQPLRSVARLRIQEVILTSTCRGR